MQKACTLRKLEKGDTECDLTKQKKTDQTAFVA